MRKRNALIRNTSAARKLFNYLIIRIFLDRQFLHEKYSYPYNLRRHAGYQRLRQVDRNLIVAEKGNMDRIAATLGLKEMSQSVLMRKICTLSGHHRTRKAIFEFDKLIRSIYTLRYLRDPQLQRDVHRSENRIESYHQLRSTIA